MKKEEEHEEKEEASPKSYLETPTKKGVDRVLWYSEKDWSKKVKELRREIYDK